MYFPVASFDCRGGLIPDERAEKWITRLSSLLIARNDFPDFDNVTARTSEEPLSFISGSLGKLNSGARLSLKVQRLSNPREHN